MSDIVLPSPVLSNGATDELTSYRVPLYSPTDLCDHTQSGVISWTFPVKHSQAGYYALLGTWGASAVPFDTPEFILSVDSLDAPGSGLLGGGSNYFFWSPVVPSVPGPYPNTVCSWPFPDWFITGVGGGGEVIIGGSGFWLSAGTHTLAVRFGAWSWDFVQDDPPLCSTVWAAYLAHLTLLAGVACPGYVYGSPDPTGLRLTVNALDPTGLQLTVPAGRNLRLTVRA